MSSPLISSKAIARLAQYCVEIALYFLFGLAMTQVFEFTVSLVAGVAGVNIMARLIGYLEGHNRSNIDLQGAMVLPSMWTAALVGASDAPATYKSLALLGVAGISYPISLFIGTRAGRES